MTLSGCQTSFFLYKVTRHAVRQLTHVPKWATFIFAMSLVSVDRF